MMRSFTKFFTLALTLVVALNMQAQTTISQWDFNSNPPDASNSTGNSSPSTGSGVISNIGGTTASFASGSSNGGSTDPATVDNTGWGITSFPAPNTGDKTGGIQFNVGTTGYQSIIVSFDLRHSNTSSRYEQFQYTTDITATTPVWVDFGTVGDGNAGDTWFNNRSFNLSTVPALDNNPNAAFRVVASFNGGSNYTASGSASTYASGGTWRFDMVTVSGTSTTPGDVTPPIAQVFKVTSNTTSFIKFSEAVSSATATTLANYVFNSSLVINSATLSTSGDTVYLNHAAIVDGQPYTLTASNVEDAAGNVMSSTVFNVLFNASLPNLVITEIAHSPNTMEFIEVYNAGATPVNLNGLIWTDGTTGDFPNVTLAAGANILFSTNPTSSAALMGGTYYTINNGLGASSDLLIIRNSLNQIVDSVEYFVGTNGWPSAPSSGPYGYSFELNSATNDNALGSNWSVPQNVISSSSGSIYGTPGSYPPPVPNPAPQVTSYKQLSATSAYVVFNQPVLSVSATTLANYSFAPALSISNAIVNGTNDTVTLTFANMPDGVAHVLTVSGVTNSSNVPNVAANLNFIWNASLPNLVITEIIHSPNDIEMIEVYNAGVSSISLGGLIWANGTTGNFPVVSLAAGATAVFATAPTTASSILNVSPVYTINNGLGSSNDILVIKNSLGQNVDSVEYFVGTNGWPTAPIGQYAYSFELTSTSVDNSLGANWIAPMNPVTPQPTQGVITATPGVYPTPPYTPVTTNVSFTGGTKVSVNEAAGTVDVVATLTGNNVSAASVDLEIIPMSTATSGSDYVLPASLQFSWAANSNGVSDTISFAINDDILQENAEYFIVRLSNPVNISLPSSTVNHFTVFINDNDKQAPAATQELSLNHLSSFSNGAAGTNSAEIVAHDPVSQRLFIANSIGAKMDIVDFTNPAAMTLISSISVTSYGNINSIAVKNGIVAAAIENASAQQPGSVVFFDTNGVFLNQVTVGAMPDMITFNNAGTKVLTANEGEPNSAYTVDPEGSVSVIDISGGIPSLTQANVSMIGFTSFNGQAATLKAAGIRIFGPGATVAQDIEPEYVAISDNDQTAWVTCQENNAFAVIDLATNTVTQLLPLGMKDYMTGSNALDFSDQGSAVQIAQWPVKGIYMPDAVAQYSVNGQTYLVTANEGDSREWNGFDETGRVGDAGYVLDSATFPYRDALKANIGRLNITTATGDTDNDGDYDEIHAYGARSFSIWNATTGSLVWDSGDELELITSKHPVYGVVFNASNANNTLKNRSDDKGPEPEGVEIAKIGNNIYAFVALERIGGCMVYNITNPASPSYVTYNNTRNLLTYGGDNGSEGIIYIDSSSSPNGLPIVILANEVSSTLSVFQVGDNVPLNIQVADIAAANVGSRNRIDWNTKSEDKGDAFEMERSTDGISFSRIGSVSGRGAPSQYTYWDENPYKGINYYRVLLKNVNGTYEYSKIVQAEVGSEANGGFNIYPNPANNVLYIMNDGTGEANVELYNVNGVMVKRQSLTSSLNVINIQSLAAGNYVVKYHNGAAVKTTKFIKH